MSQKLLKSFQRQAQAAQARMDKFAEDFAKDPAYALSWSNDTFKIAAELKILQQIIAALGEDGEGCTQADIQSTMMDRVLHKSKYPAQSTSPTSNLIEQYELAACAEILSGLQYSV
jgi:CHASE3 domain sensor protein